METPFVDVVEALDVLTRVQRFAEWPLAPVVEYA
jgi:hypothetical protein